MPTAATMKELFREQDFARVGYYQSILESEGIATHVRNRDLVGMTTEVPIPEFFPALCVVAEEDYERAMEILRESRERGGASEDIPFETKGVVFAGVLVICFSVFLTAAVGFYLNVRFFGDPDPPIGALVLAVVVMLIAAWAAVKVTLNYRATRRRRVAEGEGD